MTVKHSKTISYSDGDDPSRLQPSDWNDDHDFGTPVITVYTSAGTSSWTKTAGVTHIMVEIQGAGGGGGGAATTTSVQSAAGSGGGGGGYARFFLTSSQLLLASSISVTVGSGGSGGTGSNNGGDGGTTSVAYTNPGGTTTTYSVYGGNGGQGCEASLGPLRQQGGVGGGTSAPGVTILGAMGDPTWVVNGYNGTAKEGQAFAAKGGASFFDISGGQAPSYSSNGVAGFRGSGGSGGYNANSQGSARTGGWGGNGVVVITEFYAG
jgi:hypothetical protein